MIGSLGSAEIVCGEIIRSVKIEGTIILAVALIVLPGIEAVTVNCPLLLFPTI